MSPVLLNPENIISFSSRGMDGSQLARAWHEHDGHEMIGRGIFSGLFCKLRDVFHYYLSSLLESLLIWGLSGFEL